LILLLHDGLLVSGQRLLYRQVHSGVEALIATKLACGTPRWCCRLHLLLKALLLLSWLLLIVQLLCRLLRSPVLVDVVPTIVSVKSSDWT
jgi:hypothetical protein